MTHRVRGDGRGCRRACAIMVGAAVLVLLSIQAPAAQGRGSAADTSGISLTYAVPDAPAFTFLGVAPTKITRASSARDLGASLVNTIDSTGHVVTGVAIGATVWTLLPNAGVSLDAYQHHLGAYALANSQVSLGTARASGDSSDTNIALGLRTTLYDASDPMRNEEFVNSLTAALTDCLKFVTRPTIGVQPDSTGPEGPQRVTPDSAEQCAGAANDTLRTRWFKNNWNKPSVSVGAAIGWRIPGSELGAMDPMGVSLWLTGSMPYGASAQLVGQLQFDHRNRRDTTTATNVLSYGARLVRGTDAQNLFFEIVGTKRFDVTATTSRSNVQWSGGVELKVGEHYWVSTGFGKRYTASGQPDRLVVIADVRWGIASKARLRMLPQYGSGP